jgi:class 3 adenylate cyclase
MAPEQSVLHLAGDAILCVNRDRIIEFMNPAVTQMLGHSPEQKLGCRIASVLAHASAARLERLLDAGDQVDEPIVCVTETGAELRCRLVAFWPGRDRAGERCILVLSDIAAVEARRARAEEARAVARALAHAVVPEAFTARAEGAAFAVPVATVMVLSLGQFALDHAAPQEIMPRLAGIFVAFERRLRDFPALTKVRVFAETMLCAAGLFAQAPEPAPEEAVAFALNCIEILEDLNVKNYAQYTVQIGIHTGGPITCGAVNEGFDILGGPVKTAGILQRTAPPNTLHISEATHAQIPPTAYPMARRTVKIGASEFTSYLLRATGSSESSV